MLAAVNSHELLCYSGMLTQFVEFNMQNVTFATTASRCVSHQGLANLLVVITSQTSSALCPRRVTSHGVRCHDSTELKFILS